MAATRTTLETHAPEVDLIISYIQGFQATLTITSACELELFDKVVQSTDGATASGLAQLHEWDEDATERLLNACVALKLLTKSSNQGGQEVYKLSSAGQYLRKHGDPTLWETVGKWPKRMYGAMSKLPEEVRTAKNKELKLPPQVTFHKSVEGHQQGHGGEHGGHGHHHHHGHEHGHKHPDREHGHKHHGHEHGHKHPDHDHGHKHSDHDHGHKHPDHDRGHKHPDHDHGHKHPDHDHGHRHAHGHCHGHSHGHSHGHVHGQGHGRSLGELLMKFKSMGGALQPYLKDILTAFNLSKYSTAVDLGAGSGALSFELCRIYPSMQVTYFDVPPVTDMVKEHLVPKDENLNVTFIAGDFFEVDLPKADLYILSKIIHDWNPQQAATLLKKVYDATSPGGAIILLEKTMNDAKDGPAGAHLWDLMVMSFCGGRQRSGSEYAGLLQTAGYCDVRVAVTSENCTYDVIFATKA